MGKIDIKEEDQYRRDVYKSTRDDLLGRQLSNSEKFDNAVLTLSTGALGLSLAFIKDIVPVKMAIYLWVLKTSWCFFGLSIVLTLLSFFVSQFAINKQLEYAEEYYLNKKEEYLKRKNHFAIMTNYINYSSCLLFVAAIVFTVIFVSSNIGGQDMTETKNIRVTGGATIPSMQQVQNGKTVERGATIPSMQPVTQNQQSPSGGQSSSSGQGSGQSSSSGQASATSDGSGQTGNIKE
jgi:uncharacterized membrane protein YgcG